MTTRAPGYQPMTATVEESLQGFTVTVEHGDAQSYSRAVEPYAMKRAHQHLREHVRHGTCALDTVEWSLEIGDATVQVAPRRSLSRFSFLTDDKLDR